LQYLPLVYLRNDYRDGLHMLLHVYEAQEYLRMYNLWLLSREKHLH